MVSLHEIDVINSRTQVSSSKSWVTHSWLCESLSSWIMDPGICGLHEHWVALQTPRRFEQLSVGGTSAQRWEVGLLCVPAPLHCSCLLRTGTPLAPSFPHMRVSVMTLAAVECEGMHGSAHRELAMTMLLQGTCTLLRMSRSNPLYILQAAAYEAV